MIHRPGKLGLGTATLAAVRFAIDHHFDYLLNLDADFSHPPRFIPDLLKGMADHDVMIGSRYVPGGGVEGGFNLKRRLMSSGINGYARLMLGLTSKDNSGAFRCYRVSKLAEIDLDQVRSRGYSFQEEILYWCKIGRLPDRRNADPVRKPPRRRLQDQHARSGRRRSGSSLRLGQPAAVDGRRSLEETSKHDEHRRSERSGTARGSDHLSLADRHINFLARLGDFLAQPLVFALELAGVHAKHLAQK